MIAVSWLLLTNDVVRGEPFQTTTALLLKSLPFKARTNPAAPAVALVGEIEVIEGVAGQALQEMRGSNKIAKAPKSAHILIAATTLHVRQISGRADLQGRNSEKIVSVAMQFAGRIDMII
jgi:hypothetical protein